MLELSRRILSDYQVRKTVKQKQAFVAFLQEQIPELTVEESKFPKNKNLIMGNVDTAKVVLTAHYDTCARLPFPNFITPKNIAFYILYNLLILIPMIVAVFLVNMLLNLITGNYWAHYIASVVIYFGILLLLTCGPANKHTVNDNTSGVITLLELYSALSQEERQKIAIVFFDNEENGLLGSAAFRKKHKKVMKEKLLLNFDCVSDGDYILLAVSKKAREKYDNVLTNTFTTTDTKQILMEKAERVIYPSDQAGFNCSVAIAALKRSKLLGYYMDKIHTDKDTVFDENNITFLIDKTKEFINLI